jgi:hypothetical protein
MGRRRPRSGPSSSLWRKCCVAETVPASAGQGAVAPLYSKESTASDGDAAMREPRAVAGSMTFATGC